MNVWLYRLGAAGAMIGFFLFTVWFTGFLLSPMSSDPQSSAVRVDIPVGATATTAGKRLKQAGAIRSATAFVLMARLLGEARNLKAGEYLVPRTKGVVQIIDQLVAGDAEAQWIVIPEGKTLAQIARMLEDRRLVRAREFIEAAHKKPKLLGLEIPVSRESVDGYLMPDTYKFPRKTSEQAIIKELLRNWNRKVLRPNQELFTRSEFSMDEILIIASLIEREARVPQDRPLISAVIRNRLKKNMPLQIDATVLYALGRHKNIVTHRDLQVDSPYNTYRNKGLPPAPICNPGADAIRAALQPAPEDFLYYVARPDGSHIFTRTFDEHRAAIQRVKQMRKEAAEETSS